MTQDDDWTAGEEQALRALADEVPPGPALEASVVARLRSRGMIGSRRPRLLPWAVRSLAASLLLCAGFFLGRAAPTDAAPRFALLLYGGSASDPARSAERVREYGAWARRLAAAGQLGAAEKLATPVAVLGPAHDAAAAPSGYFLLTVSSASEAVAIARECPHLRHGGRIVVQAIDPT